jgi:hypothetical protein
MISLREGKLFPPFHPGSSFPGGRGTRRVERVENDSAGAPFPRVSLARNRERMVPIKQKPPREDAEILCTESGKFSKKPPPRRPLGGWPPNTSSGVAVSRFGGGVEIFFRAKLAGCWWALHPWLVGGNGSRTSGETASGGTGGRRSNQTCPTFWTEGTTVPGLGRNREFVRSLLLERRDVVSWESSHAGDGCHKSLELRSV